MNIFMLAINIIGEKHSATMLSPRRVLSVKELSASLFKFKKNNCSVTPHLHQKKPEVLSCSTYFQSCWTALQRAVLIPVATHEQAQNHLCPLAGKLAQRAILARYI